MTKIHLGRGSVVVEEPGRPIYENLVRFRHDTGQYEDLFQQAPRHDAVVTMPGFAARIQRLSEPFCKVIDERMPLPEPVAFGPMDAVWRTPLEKAVTAEGGIVSIPDVFGFSRAVAALLTAYPKERLIDRGTPLSIVAVRDGESSARVRSELHELLPGREVGCFDSDDIIVVTYRALGEAPRHLAGVFIGDDVLGNFDDRAGDISAVRNAVRFGIAVSPLGGDIAVDLVAEGLFGPLVASVSHADAVKAGKAAPISVVWVPCPPPRIPLVSAPLEVLEAIVQTENPDFVNAVAFIVRSVSSNTGCLVQASTVALAKRLTDVLPSLVTADGRRPHKSRQSLNDICSGTVRKAVLTDGVIPLRHDHGILVMASCQGVRAVGNLIPGRLTTKPGEKAYIVDFAHDWDIHNGRPGRLALNDAARRKRYQDLGFNQIQVDSVRSLPFVR